MSIMLSFTKGEITFNFAIKDAFQRYVPGIVDHQEYVFFKDIAISMYEKQYLFENTCSHN